MTSITKGLRFLYILQFIEDEIKICNFINETFCAQSILGKNEDLFHQLNDELYQFFAIKNHVIIKPLENVEKNITELTPWIQQFIKENYMQIFDLQIHTDKNSIYEEAPKFYFLRLIKLKMTLKLFNKITNNPNDHTKHYSPQEFFLIAYSYAFSILDNRIILLKNILFSIWQGTFNLNNIYGEYIVFASKNFANSEYLAKLKNQISKNQYFDLHSKIYDFIMENYNFQSNDLFLKNLYFWNQQIMNLITLIQRTFCFRIKNREGETIIKIYTVSDYECTYDLEIEKLESLLFILPDECIFACEYFNYERLHEFVFFIFTFKRNMKIQFNITEFFKRLQSLSREKLIQESNNLEFFFSYILNRQKQPIDLIIYSNKLKINYYYDFELSCLKEEVFYQKDESLFISLYILINIYDIDNLIKNIANIILSYFINFEFEDYMKMIYVSQNYKISEFEYANSLSRRNFMLNPYFLNDKLKTFAHGTIKSITIDGLEYNEHSMICIDGCNQEYKNLEFLTGIFDMNISFFIVDFQSRQFSQLSNFVSQWISDFREEFEDIDRERCDQNTKLFSNNSLEKNYSIFHINSQDCHRKPKQLICSFVGSYKEIQNCPDCTQKLLSEYYPQNKMDNHGILKLYHDNIFKYRNYEFENKKIFKTSNFSTQKYQNRHHSLRIENSDFHLFLFRFIECKSIDPKLSSIFKNGVTDEIEIYNCHVNFVHSYFDLFKHITLNNCIIKFHTKIFHQIGSHIPLNIKFLNFQTTQPFKMFDFVRIEPIDNKSAFISHHSQTNFEVYLENCRIYIFAVIPSYILNLKLSNCQIFILKDSFLEDLKYETNQLRSYTTFSEKMAKNRNNLIGNNTRLHLKIESCILPKNFEISGMFGKIQLINNTSNIILNSLCEYVEIKNHRNSFCISSLNLKTISKENKNNSLNITSKPSVVIRNFIVDEIFDVELDEISFKDCSINKMDNIISRVIKIKNTQCSFQIWTPEGIQKYSGILENLELSKPVLKKFPFQPLTWRKWIMKKF